jgi:hypothetical protein
MAIDCQWLRRTIDSSRPDPFVTLCTHIVRDGEDCVGPFLEDVETGCGLWSAAPPVHGPRRHALARG